MSLQYCSSSYVHRHVFIRLAPGSKEKRSRSSDPRPRPRSMFSPGPPQGDTKPWYMREPRDPPSIGMMKILL